MEKLIFIDTHAHICDPAFAGEEPDVIKRALEAGVQLILQPDIDSRERNKMSEVAMMFPDTIRKMAGLYPGSVDRNWENEIQLVEEAASQPGIVAIGEIGLDYHYSRETANLQKAALKAQFEIAARFNLPVNIHERDATEDFFSVMDECKSLGLRGNLHAFNGSWETFCRLQEYGDWSVGIGGVVTFRNAKVAETVKRIPADRIVLETDAPYLTPVPYRGMRNESAYIPIIAAKIAELKGMSIKEVAAATTSNACRLFNLSLT